MLERAAGVLLGATLVGAGIRQIVEADGVTVSVVSGGLALVVGVLFAVRRPMVRDGSLRSSALALPSLVVGSVALHMAGPAQLSTSPIAAALVVLGTAISLLSLAALGRSFAILPSIREIVGGGPYRVVRHPLFAGQLLIVIGSLAADRLSASDVGLVAAAIFWLVVRIRAEERLLVTEANYAAYAARVRWRLVPGIW